jgi:hypothetical protein
MRLTTALTNVAVLSALAGPALLCGSPAVAVPQERQEQAQTEDVLYLKDGRVFHGRIVSEDRTEILFEYVDRNANIRTTLPFSKDQVDRIERDVPIKTTAEPEKTAPRRSVGGEETEDERSYGTRRGALEDENLPLIYVVPMKGQMGTDINPDVYKEMLQDIRDYGPDLIVIELECRDNEERLYSRIEANEKGFDGLQYLDKYHEIASFFHDELRDVPQTVWIQDSRGISSILAMAWTNPEQGRHLLMAPNARLGGLGQSAINFLRVQSDANTLGKYREAYMARLKGFAEYGGVNLEVIDAMVRPEFPLSATWQGRNVTWTLDRVGEYLVDGSEERTADFTVKTAEDFCLSDGTADTLDDLALLSGMREYRIAEGRAEEIFENYKEGWRAAFESCKNSFRDYDKYMGWATGEDTARYLGRAKRELEKVIAAIDRYPPVEIRLVAEFGQQASRFNLVTQVEILEEQLRALRQAGRGAAGGAGGGRGPGGAAGGGGGGGGRRPPGP